MSQATIEKLRVRLGRLTEHANEFENMFGSRSDEADEEVAFYRDAIAYIERLEAALGNMYYVWSGPVGEERAWA